MRQNRRGRNRGMRKGLGAKGFDNGGETRVRGNVHQLLERYLQLARDAGLTGDRIAAENYLQHAEHYYRVINETGMNNRPRFNGRDLSVAAINVQNVNSGISTSLYSNGPIVENSENLPERPPSSMMNGDDQEEDFSSHADQPESMREEHAVQEDLAVQPEPKRRSTRARPRRISKEDAS